MPNLQSLLAIVQSGERFSLLGDKPQGVALAGKEGEHVVLPVPFKSRNIHTHIKGRLVGGKLEDEFRFS